MFLNDGTVIHSVYFTFPTIACDTPNAKHCGDVYLKTDGADVAMGKNLFSFVFNADGSVVPNGQGEYSFNKYCKTTRPDLCTAWLLKYENMDYLKCPEKLDWDGKHKCSD